MAIYQGSYLSPQNISIDGTQNNVFQCQVNGTSVTDYQLIIYQMDNTIIYDTTKINLTTPLYNKNIFTLTIPASTFANNQQLKWTITFWEGTSSATSRETPFYAYTIPTVSMTVGATITSQQATFTATYSQAEGVALNRWYMVFLNASDNIILQTPYSYSGLISYIFTGFLNNTTYKVYTVVENQLGVITQSDTYTFDVSYSPPSTNIVPSVTLLPDLSAIQTDWSLPIQVTGAITGTSSYVPGLFTPTNTGLKLDSGSYVEFDLDIPSNFTTTFAYIPDPSFTSGIFVELDALDGTTYQIGYDGTKYYYINKGNTVSGTPKSFLYVPCLVCVKGVEVLIIYNNQIYEDLHT